MPGLLKATGTSNYVRTIKSRSNYRQHMQGPLKAIEATGKPMQGPLKAREPLEQLCKDGQKQVKL